MRPISQMSDEVAAGITTLFCDIDDTLTTDGRLPACAYTALEDLTGAGINVAPITGRPAGWCDMIARIWPVTGVVGENGAFYFSYDANARKMIRQFAVPEATRSADRARLEKVRARVLTEVPGAAVSADQRYRESDLAIDFCEDVPALSRFDIDRITAIFEQEGAVAKVSPIHVNGWYGDYDKLTMSRRFASEILGTDIALARDRVVFVGDSPNDAPMFGFFPHSCGVANVREFQGRMDADPIWVTKATGGQGFVEVAERLLSTRRTAVNTTARHRA